MRRLRDHAGFRASLKLRRMVHVLAVASKDECLGYPAALRALRAATGHHTFFAVEAGDDEQGYLTVMQRRHRARLRQLLPSVRLGPVDEVLGALRTARDAAAFCVDVSGMTRIDACRIVGAVLDLADPSATVFCAYSAPQRYISNPVLETPSRIHLLYGVPDIAAGQPSDFVVLPGVDISDTSVLLAYVLGKTCGNAVVRWLLPVFSTRREIYEDVLESHQALLRAASSIELLPEDDLFMAAHVLRRYIESGVTRAMFIAPLGSPLTSVSAVLAARAARVAGLRVNVLMPGVMLSPTRRSEGYSEPMVEAIAGGWPSGPGGAGDANDVDAGKRRGRAGLRGDAVDCRSAGGRGTVIDYRPQGPGASAGDVDEPALSPSQ